jgi:hypothetical protein
VGNEYGKSQVIVCLWQKEAKAKLTGYAGGLTRKQWLLEHEGMGIPVTQP